MKIIQTNKFFYKKGGSEAYMFDLADMLKEKGHDVGFMSMKDPKNLESEYAPFFVSHKDFSERKSILQLIRSIGSYIFSKEAYTSVKKLVEIHGPDIAHLHNITRHLTPSVIKAYKDNGVPVVQTLHDYQVICPNYKLFTEGSACERCKKHRYWQSALHKCVGGSFTKGALAGIELAMHKATRVYDSVDHFVTPSNFLRDKLIEWGMDGNRITHIPNFIDVDAYAPRYSSEGYFVYFGRLSAEKGVLTILKALRELDNQEVVFKIIGTGPQEKFLQAYVKQHDIKNVDFLGFQSGDDLHRLVRNARFVVLPSIWYENYPISLLEAAALGKPALVSAIGGNIEIVKDGKTGLHVDPYDAKAWADAISKIFMDTPRLEEMGRAARDLVESRNNKDAHYAALMEVYKKVIT